jgi:MerR family redox-sensitive transcriptional activator SoxR
MAATLTIGQVADAAGVNPSAIRYYERQRILPQPERLGGKRLYDGAILQRLAVIDVAKQAGFSLEEIRLLFDATDRGAPAHARLKDLAHRKLPEIEDLITHAQRVKVWLEATSDCTCDTLEQCSLFDHGLPETSPSDRCCS